MRHLNRRTLVTYAFPVALVTLLAFVPRIDWNIPKLFSGPINSPGTLQLLALCLLFGAAALTYDLLFGFTGLLSFGHTLYFAVGVYMANIAMTKWDWSFEEALLFTAGLGIALPLLIGAISLRVGGIAFAMVTLAFAQVGATLAIRNPHDLTGGEEGLGTDYTKLPSYFVGILNTKYLYWLALGYAVCVFVIVRLAIGSSPGHVWQAIRENELRVQVLGLHPYPYKLMSFVLACFLCTAGGVVYLLLQTGSNPEVASANMTLTFLVMVVLGGAGTKWGAVVGGALYWYLKDRLGAIGDSSTVQDLPGILKTPLSEPLFLLGVLFILVVYFLPGGIVGIGARARGAPSGLRRLSSAIRGSDSSGVAPVAAATPEQQP
jgi:branched-chain amino acid transport system permease protein